MKRFHVIWAFAISSSLYAASVFDYGIASKGPLRISGAVVNGVNLSLESNVYIESLNDDNALELCNSQLAGSVKIVNPQASVSMFGGVTSIGGETGQNAIDHHVQFGVPMLVFTYPDTSHFIQYLSGETLTDSYINGGSYRNIRIPAETNPHFLGSVQLKGIIYIEQPNIVTFAGPVDITGIIVGADPSDNSGANAIDFRGSITGHSITTLDATFDSRLKEEQGTFLIAPGFEVRFGDVFNCLYGCIAANGIKFHGLAGGVIGGSILNYSDEPMRIEGNNSIYFNRSGITDVPSGFRNLPLYTCNAYLPMDFNEDCKVDLIDFAVFVEHWMECHREPIEACSI